MEVRGGVQGHYRLGRVTLCEQPRRILGPCITLEKFPSQCRQASYTLYTPRSILVNLG